LQLLDREEMQLKRTKEVQETRKAAPQSETTILGHESSVAETSDRLNIPSSDVTSTTRINNTTTDVQSERRVSDDGIRVLNTESPEPTPSVPTAKWSALIKKKTILRAHWKCKIGKSKATALCTVIKYDPTKWEKVEGGLVQRPILVDFIKMHKSWVSEDWILHDIVPDEPPVEKPSTPEEALESTELQSKEVPAETLKDDAEETQEKLPAPPTKRAVEPSSIELSKPNPNTVERPKVAHPHTRCPIWLPDARGSITKIMSKISERDREDETSPDKSAKVSEGAEVPASGKGADVLFLAPTDTKESLQPERDEPLYKRVGGKMRLRADVPDCPAALRLCQQDDITIVMYYEQEALVEIAVHELDAV